MTPHSKIEEVPSYKAPVGRKNPSRKRVDPKVGLSLKKTPQRRVAVSVKKPKKPKVRTNLSLADELFSKRIIERDKKCQFPNCVSQSKLTCSHYFNRGKFTTRFDEKNCITLCQAHHYMNRVVGWEFQKQRLEKHGWDGQYTLFMKNWLGEEEFSALEARAKKSTKQQLAILAFMETVDNLSKEG